MKKYDLALAALSGQSVFLGVDHFHAPGETVHAQSLFMEPGGKGYNQAVAAARLGAKVACLTALGDDADGRACALRLEREGVTPIPVIKDAPTAYAAILTDRGGENRVTVYPGASALLTGQDVTGRFSQAVREARMLLLTQEIPEEAFAALFGLAQEAGVPVVLNPAPYAPWAVPFAAKAALITPNLSEAQALLGLPSDPDADPLAIGKSLRAAGFSRAVVTLGSRGALVVDGDEPPRVLAAQPVKAVDTTGAGDCFNAALCVRLLAGDDLSLAARFAVRASALSVTRPHVLDAMPRLSEVDDFV